MLGIGSGGGAVDNEMFSLDVEAGSTRDRAYDAIDVITKIWEGKPSEFHSKFYDGVIPETTADTLRGFHMKPYQQPHPPIAVAGSSPYSSTLEVVGERGWLPLSTCFLYEDYLPSHWEVVEKGAKKAGLTPSRNDWRISREVYVAEDGAKAREEALEVFGKFFVDYWIPLLGRRQRS